MKYEFVKIAKMDEYYHVFGAMLDYMMGLYDYQELWHSN